MINIGLFAVIVAATLFSGFGAARYAVDFAGAVFGAGAFMLAARFFYRPDLYESTVAILVGILVADWLGGYRAGLIVWDWAEMQGVLYAEGLMLVAILVGALAAWFEKPGLSGGGSVGKDNFIPILLLVISAGILGYRIAM
jgi:hypothetical protein